jgi:hypothetical protein
MAPRKAIDPPLDRRHDMLHPTIHQALANERQTQMRRAADQARISRRAAPPVPSLSFPRRSWIAKILRVARA